MSDIPEKETPLAKYKLLEKYSQFIDYNNNTIFSSALFTEHVDFDLSYFPLKHLGYKIIVASTMNILAMNATPTQVRINMALSNRFAEEAIDELMSGIMFCCSKFKIDLMGLDFKPSVLGLTIATSMLGEVAPEQKVGISGAKENELICVTGDLGSAYTGLILLEREKKVFQADPTQQPDFIGVDYLLERYLKPEPPAWGLRDVRAQNFAPLQPTSMINLTDGLATGLIHLCNASKLGCTIFEEKLPIDILTFDKLKELGIVATTIALNGGEDYELLFTIKQEDFEKIKEIKEISVIGYMTPESSGRHIITNDNRQFELKAQGF
ncbi:MAG: thiamine-phosphate kinase [Bacteroidetes bacterium]|nr:thiamine-phosphate kinase [Bacteroidota bacterium]MCL2302480.1 thiamine-phosphate kinase [Lentimicrobiaceae bacterium]